MTTFCHPSFVDGRIEMQAAVMPGAQCTFPHQATKLLRQL
jgi:hypothetical protein